MNRRGFISSSILGTTSLFAPSILKANPNLQTIAECKAGRFRGSAINGILAFKGIKYGDAARFKAPTTFNYRANKGNEIIEVQNFGNACFQSNKNESNQSEDCLFLNIFTPNIDAKLRPLMFYIHGGAYSNGSANDDLYDGTTLCLNGNVVVVTINHRLNAFGYLYLHNLEKNTNGGAEFKYSGNAGQLDIICALNWVKANIAAFGGNPNNIMVFGQSGGGAKIATLMATPIAKGLFHKAATMSGQQVTASGPQNATKRTLSLLTSLGLKPDENGIASLKSVPAQDIIAALKTTDPIIGSGGLYMGPVLDEITLFNHPFYPKANGWGTKIPMIIGNTLDETKAFLGGDETNHNLNWSDLPRVLPPQYRVDIDPFLVIDTYRKLYPNMSASDVFFAATTAGRSWRGAIIEAQERAKIGSNTYVYQFNYRSKKDGGKWGAAHTIDIPAAFGTMEAKSSICDTSKEAYLVSKTFSQCFINFAKFSNPNTNSIKNWRPYSLEHRETLIFDVNSRLENDPRGGERKLFDKVPFTQQGT